MALPTWTDVIAIAPELTVTDPTSQDAFLGYAIGQCNATAWGALLNNGIVYLCAHMATLARLRGAGMVTFEQVGEMSREYAKPLWLKSSLGLTVYGIEYYRLIRLLPTALGAVF